jgi:hypothetical protein
LPIFAILMMDAIIYSETSVLTRATLRHIPEDGILHLLFVNCVSGVFKDVVSQMRPLERQMVGRSVSNEYEGSKKNEHRDPYSANEPYRLNDSQMSAKFSANCC